MVESGGRIGGAAATGRCFCAEADGVPAVVVGRGIMPRGIEDVGV